MPKLEIIDDPSYIYSNDSPPMISVEQRKRISGMLWEVRRKKELYSNGYNSMNKDEEVILETITLERTFVVIIKRDENGIFCGSVPGLKGCHAEAKTLDELRENMIENVCIYLKEMPNKLRVYMEYIES